MVDSAPRPRKAPPSVSGPKTISNVLAEERPFLSARIGIAMIGPGGLPAAGGSSFDESQSPNHGSWCRHQHDRSVALSGNMSSITRAPCRKVKYDGGMLLLCSLKPHKLYRFCTGDHYAKGKSITDDC